MNDIGSLLFFKIFLGVFSAGTELGMRILQFTSLQIRTETND